MLLLVLFMVITQKTLSNSLPIITPSPMAQKTTFHLNLIMVDLQYCLFYVLEFEGEFVQKYLFDDVYMTKQGRWASPSNLKDYLVLFLLTPMLRLISIFIAN
jgi:hypothetical protein